MTIAPPLRHTEGVVYTNTNHKLLDPKTHYSIRGISGRYRMISLICVKSPLFSPNYTRYVNT